MSLGLSSIVTPINIALLSLLYSYTLLFYLVSLVLPRVRVRGIVIQAYTSSDESQLA